MIQFIKPERPVHSVFIHCSASDSETMAGDVLVKTVTAWHKARGFNPVGYHFLIDKAGKIMPGRSLEEIPAAQQGHNIGSIAICVHGLDVHKFTPEAMQSLRWLCDDINRAYVCQVAFRGHCEVSAKTCPIFDYRAVLNLQPGGRMPLMVRED
jgi:N-acetylmuramoyl-L-alanine amidase